MNEIRLADGGALTVRPIENTDVERLERMFERLSRTSIYFRFFSPIPQHPPATLQRLADVDHCCREALVALDGDEIVAVARYDALGCSGRSRTRDAELAVTVEDAWQRRGVGLQLVSSLAVLARARDYDEFLARSLPDNRAALGLVRELVPNPSVKFTGGDYEARLPLAFARPPTSTAHRRPRTSSAHGPTSTAKAQRRLHSAPGSKRPDGPIRAVQASA